MQKTTILAASVLLCATVVTPTALRAADAPAPAASHPASAEAKRTPEQIMNDIRKVEQEMSKGVEMNVETLLDPAKRDATGPKVLPSLKKILGLAEELEGTGAQGKVIAGQIRPEMLTLLSWSCTWMLIERPSLTIFTVSAPSRTSTSTASGRSSIDWRAAAATGAQGPISRRALAS